MLQEWRSNLDGRPCSGLNPHDDSDNAPDIICVVKLDLDPV